MGINSVNGQDLAALFVSTTNKHPAPELHRPDAEAIASMRTEQTARTARAMEPTTLMVSTHSSIRVDKESNRIVVRILDQNNQVLKQIPPEELLEIASKLRQLQAVLFDEHV